MTRGIEIYLKENIPEEELIYKIWSVYKQNSHPQVLFRKALLTGLSILYLNNDMNRELLKEIDTRLLLPPTPIMDTLLEMAKPKKRKYVKKSFKAVKEKPVIQKENNKIIDKEDFSFQNKKVDIRKPKLGKLM